MEEQRRHGDGGIVLRKIKGNTKSQATAERVKSNLIFQRKSS